MLTTQEAAALLGVSRPTLVRLLDRAEIPSTRPGRHRRVLLADVLDYRRRLREPEVLNQMTTEAEEADESLVTSMTNHPKDRHVLVNS